jgi:hypothetical protein
VQSIGQAAAGMASRTFAREVPTVQHQAGKCNWIVRKEKFPSPWRRRHFTGAGKTQTRWRGHRSAADQPGTGFGLRGRNKFLGIGCARLPWRRPVPRRTQAGYIRADGLIGFEIPSSRPGCRPSIPPIPIPFSANSSSLLPNSNSLLPAGYNLILGCVRARCFGLVRRSWTHLRKMSEYFPCFFPVKQGIQHSLPIFWGSR